ncbi:hypothetical protein CR969_02085 [Candidatus Saccharibacteria bacterium]|nr:MAG: hypothetical protein CR969_02085 [Candidatus Saccharibacteria bacterium]
MEWFKSQRRSTFGWSQRLILLIAGLLIGLFVGTIANFTPVAAQASDGAVWKNDQLTYQGKNYSKASDQLKKDLKRSPEEIVYTYKENTNGGSIVPHEKLHTIIFAAGENPESSTSAKYLVYKVELPNNYSPGAEETISVTTSEEETSCKIPGFGWIVCGMAPQIANAMDWIFDKVSILIMVPPLESGSNSGTYQAWVIMRAIANIGFVIAFLIVIYSHTTSIGLSNYNIKKLLPRIVIAAILVNVSYYVCALAIDLSNILGSSIGELFTAIREQVLSGDLENYVDINWGDFVAGAIAGTSAIAGGVIALDAKGGVFSAVSVLLLPILLSMLLALLVVFLVLAARQALIVILTVISPLAFLCYLLPGTEKWFEKWRNTMFTMLIFFPAFAVIFGGSQLAGLIVMRNASSMLMVLLGLAVQVAPLAIAPVVLKLSGGVLNRFAGIVNDKNRGLIDRSRKWAQERSEYLANRRSLSKKDGELKWYNFSRRSGRYLNHRRRAREERIANYQLKADAAYEATRRHEKQDIMRRETEQDKQITQKVLDSGWSRQLTSDKSLREKDLRLRVSTDEVTGLEEGLKARYENFKTGVDGNLGLDNLQQRAAKSAQDIALQSLATQSAQRVQSDILARQIDSSPDLQGAAGRLEDIYYENLGKGSNRGSQRVRASALQTVSSANEDAVKNADTIINYGNYTNPQIAQMANGHSIPNGPTVTADIQTAAIRKIYGGPDDVTLNAALKSMDLSSLTAAMKQEIGEALLSNSAKPAWIGNSLAADIKANRGRFMSLSGQDLYDEAISVAINLDKLDSADKLLSQTAEYIKEIATSLPNISANIPIERKQAIMNQIIEARQNPMYRGRIAERREGLKAVYDTLASQGASTKYSSYDDIPDIP